MMKQYAPALKHIADIIEKGIREHPGKKALKNRNWYRKESLERDDAFKSVAVCHC